MTHEKGAFASGCLCIGVVPVAMAGGGRLALAGAHEPRRACRAARSIISAVRRSSPDLVRSGDDSVVQCGSSPRRANSGTHRPDVVLHVEREHVTYVGEERRTSTTFALTVLTTGGARHTRWGTGQVPTRSRALEHIRSHSGCPGRCRQNVLWVGTTPYTRCRTHRSEPPSTCDGARRSARTLTSKRLHSSCTCTDGACDWSAQPS